MTQWEGLARSNEQFHPLEEDEMKCDWNHLVMETARTAV